MRNIFNFFGFSILGAVVSLGLSFAVHTAAGLAMGVPLARLGVHGAIAQIGLLILPFVIGAALAGFAVWRRQRRVLRWRTVGLNALAVLGLSIVLFWSWIVLSGVWFGLVQADPPVILLNLFVPPFVVAATYLFVLPLTVRFLVARGRRDD